MDITATFHQRIEISHQQSLKIAISAIQKEVFNRVDCSHAYLFEKDGDIYEASTEFEELNAASFAFKGTPERLAALKTVGYLQLQLTILNRKGNDNEMAA
jgi:hypothetical protein